MASLADPDIAGGACPGAEACRAQLARILASPDFDATDRGRRFLAYVVEEALAGRADRIKAYSIATGVFGRDAAFDPQTDPIVRVEAGHMRRSLDRYYLAAGRDDPVGISVPKGGYAPAFAWRPDAPDAARHAAAAPATGWRGRLPWLMAGACAILLAAGLGFAAGLRLGRTAETQAALDVPRLVVEPFRSLNRSEQGEAAAAGLTAETIAEISRFKDIVVVAGTASGGLPARYRLTGTTAVEGSALRVQAQLVRASDDTVLWADAYRADLDTEGLLASEPRIAGAVATAVGQPYGAIFQADAAARAVEPGRGGAYACTLDYFAYRAVLDAPGFARARACLADAVSRFPDYATAWALLAQTSIDGVRFGFDPAATLDGALAEARHALTLEPMNVRGLQAKMLALYLVGDLEGGQRTGAAGIAINPNDTELLGEYGYRLAIAGRWNEGCGMLQQAVDRNPGPLPYYETGLALCAYIDRRYADAAAWIRTASLQEVGLYHVIAAAILAEAGDAAGAARERAWLMTRSPGLVAGLEASLVPRVGRPEDLARFLASLRKAGLDVGEQGTRPTPG